MSSRTDSGDVIGVLEQLLPRLQALFSGEASLDTCLRGVNVKNMVEQAMDAYSSFHSSPRDAGKEPFNLEQHRQQQKRLQNAMQILYYLEHAHSCSLIVSRLISIGLDADLEFSVDEADLSVGIAPFYSLQLDAKMNPFQMLLIFLLNTLRHLEYRRVGQDCYKRLFTPEGHDTHAWVQVCSIKEFVYTVTRKETNFDQWLNVTRGSGNAAAAAEYLASCRDVQFPVVKKDRNMFAFRNGLYESRTDTFYAYGIDKIPSAFAACKYFDAEFPKDAHGAEANEWRDIPTPHLQSILDFQEFEPEVCDWMYIMLGRLFYTLNDLDGWQVIPYLKGQASSGKSTILLRVCRNFYDKADVGVLSNNIEKKFGIGAFSDKFLFVAPEIKSDLQMEQAEFQSMVSGEDMSIAGKYKDARMVVWLVPGIMAGNEVPGWVDNSGSITRRIVLFDFSKKVDNADMDLGKKLEAELPAIILKCNRAYLWATRRYAKDSIWKHLPAYFHSTRQELSESTNVLEHFFQANVIRFGSDLYMPWQDFLTAFQMHVRSHNFKHTNNFTKDYYTAAFTRYNLKRVAKQSRLYHGKPKNCVWLVGADIVDGNVECDADEE